MAFRNSRWTAPVDQFAVRITTDQEEIHGLLTNSVVIEPGTRAFVVQEGSLLGELPSGEYSVKRFEEKLQFWRKGQTTLILARSEPLVVDVFCKDYLTADSLTTNVNVRATVQIKDIASFLFNLLGPRDSFSCAELREKVVPLIQRSVWEAVARRTMGEMKHATVAFELSKQIGSSITLSLQRYGLSFVEVEALSADHAEYELFLKRLGQQNIAIAEEKAVNKKMEAELGVIEARAAIRQKLREAVLSDNLDRISNKEKLRQSFLDVNKDRLLQTDEIERLVEGFEEKKDDRQALREHLLNILDMRRQQEADEIRSSMTHEIKLRALKSEKDLAEMAGDVANVSWRQELQREIDEAGHKNQQHKAELTAKWDRIRESNRNRREESWQDLAHRKGEEELRLQVEVSEIERKSRIAVLEQELAAQIDQQKIAMEKRRREWEAESTERESMSQLARLQKVQEMNLQLEERQQKMRSDLEELKADKGHQRELQKMDAMGKLGTDAVIATASASNASILAELKKHELSEHSKRASSDFAYQAELNNERLRLYEKLSDSEKAKADAISQAFKDAMQGQQSTVQQMISGLASVNSTSAPPSFPPSRSEVGIQNTEQWFVGVDGRQTGPFSRQQMLGMIQQSQISISTHVWKQGMATWQTASECHELSKCFQTAPALPPGQPPS